MLRIKLSSLLLAVAFFSSVTFAAKPETGFLNRTVTIGRTTFRYQVYVPANWNKNQKWPVILFLHGAGERGDDGLAQTDIGIGTAIRKKNERFPAIVVMPLCRKDSRWIAPEMESQALKALNESIKEFNGDTTRIYLTGLSMGGQGTWYMASRYNVRFAAIVAICGRVKVPENILTELKLPVPPADFDPYADIARKVGKTPTWIFHGEQDPTVPVEESRQIYAAMKAIGGNVKYTEYPGVNHNSWDKAYAEPELMTWLLSHRIQD